MNRREKISLLVSVLDSSVPLYQKMAARESLDKLLYEWVKTDTIGLKEFKGYIELIRGK